jgi:hypothetical protein
MSNGVEDVVVDKRCTLEVRPEIWDLRGEMWATFSVEGSPPMPSGFMNSNQTLQVVVTVALQGNILNYLCETKMCVCLAFEACGCAPVEKDLYKCICLTGDQSPCRRKQWEFVIDVPPGTFDPGRCGREYKLCITLGSKDCCGKVGFVYGSCDAYKITVVPPQQDDAPEQPLEAAATQPAEAAAAQPAEAAGSQSAEC